MSTILDTIIAHKKKEVASCKELIPVNELKKIVITSYSIHYTKLYEATICTGMAASMAAVLLCAGTKGKRSALKHSRVMIHQPMGGAQGQASDIEITTREIVKLKAELYKIISDHSGTPVKTVEKDSDRDYWMTSEEAKAYGMVDEVLLRTKRNNFV